MAEQLLPVEPSQPSHHKAQKVAVRSGEARRLGVTKHEKVDPHVVVERTTHRHAVNVTDFQIMPPIVLAFEPFGRQCLEQQTGSERLVTRYSEDLRQVNLGSPP